MKVSQSKWLVCEEDGLIHVVPETDTRPHGIKINNKKYELSYKCNCNPKISVTDVNGQEYKKTIVVHNSFEQDEYLNDIVLHTD